LIGIKGQGGRQVVGGRKKIHQPPACDKRVVVDVSGKTIAVLSQSDGVVNAKNP